MESLQNELMLEGASSIPLKAGAIPLSGLRLQTFGIFRINTTITLVE